MIFSTFQSVLIPVTFLALFLQMLVYWWEAAFLGRLRDAKQSLYLFQFSSVSLTLLIVLRWLESGHLPLSNLYESLLFLSWSFLTIQAVFLFDLFHFVSNLMLFSSLKKQRSGEKQKQLDNPEAKDYLQRKPYRKIKQDDLVWMGVVLSPMAFLSFSFAFLSLPKEMQKATALVPALQSNWLMMHVTVMILSYAALLCGSILSIALLLLHQLQTQRFSHHLQSILPRLRFSGFKNQKTIRNVAWNRLQDSSEKILFNAACLQISTNAKHQANLVMPRQYNPHPFPLEKELNGEKTQTKEEFHAILQPNEKQNVLSDRLDSLSYRMISFGFPLLTLGILSGAVWANAAWGSYWSWDPKETWALITWLVFAIYLHTRMTKGWKGESSALVATIGFFVVWFCYLGVNLLGTGLHSYGWFSK